MVDHDSSNVPASADVVLRPYRYGAVTPLLTTRSELLGLAAHAVIAAILAYLMAGKSYFHEVAADY